MAPVAAPAVWSIRLDVVVVRYPNGVVGRHDETSDLGADEMVSTAGISDSGTSTLIRTVDGLVPVTEGTLRVGGHRVDGASARSERRLRGERTVVVAVPSSRLDTRVFGERGDVRAVARRMA